MITHQQQQQLKQVKPIWRERESVFFYCFAKIPYICWCIGWSLESRQRSFCPKTSTIEKVGLEFVQKFFYSWQNVIINNSMIIIIIISVCVCVCFVATSLCVSLMPFVDTFCCFYLLLLLSIGHKNNSLVGVLSHLPSSPLTLSSLFLSALLSFSLATAHLHLFALSSSHLAYCSLVSLTSSHLIFHCLLWSRFLLSHLSKTPLFWSRLL